MLDFANHPGQIYVVATLLPLASFLLILLAGAARCALRCCRESGGTGESLYKLFGGDNPGRLPAFVATGAIALAFVCSLIGFINYQIEHSHADEPAAHAHDHAHDHDHDHEGEKKNERWTQSIPWALVNPKDESIHGHGTMLELGYYIDGLSTVMFLMVTLIATLIHVFSMGYMSDELTTEYVDHEVHTEGGHLHRRGRFGRFFLFLSLFCFSMLNLILADNLFQVFLSWELVGVCSFLLIGFYYERHSASTAANKAFITNRVGDAGFIIGMLIVWTYIGTFNFQDIFASVRAPATDAHGARMEMVVEKGSDANPVLGGKIVRAEPVPADEANMVDGFRDLKITDQPVTFDTQVVLFLRNGHLHSPKASGANIVTVSTRGEAGEYGSMPYWLLVAAGLGIFLGCVGKSAQFPLQVWLPDAMEGPTPVSALIHAATMVAAGVYLVGRVYPMFTPEVLLVIAYTGAITLFVAATIAVVMNDIKKVLAYSTVSQLGYMMLALGVGGWMAGLFHLITHAFFKALLFLGSGSVIYGCHHVQDMDRMGGLYRKMKITALTMLMGVLAIAGIPLFSGWYSKDSILAQSIGYVTVHPYHALLFVLPILTAGITSFYMFRMWLLTFTGKPKDQHVHDHAHESPRMMTIPLIVLAVCAIAVGWGWPLWNAEASALGAHLHHAQPVSVPVEFGHVGEGLHKDDADALGNYANTSEEMNIRHAAHELHSTVGYIALAVILVAISFAFIVYYYRRLDPAEATEQFPGVHRFLLHKWYFDEAYSALFVRPALAVANWFRFFDATVIDGIANGSGKCTVWTSFRSGGFDLNIVDGLVNLTSRVFWRTGSWLRNIQTGYLRSYVLFLVLAAIVIWILLTYFMGSAMGGN